MHSDSNHSPARGPLHILHLEDDPRDAQLVEAALRQEGIECVITQVSTREAYEAALAQGDIDLILSDYALPGFDGLWALSLAREAHVDAPFILLSGTLGEEAAIESLRGGATDYVLKHRLNRLVPAALRAVEEAVERRTRRAAERALERERLLLRALLDSLEVGVVACDHEGVLTYLNRATRELHGLAGAAPTPEQWAEHSRLYHTDGKTPLDPRAYPLERALNGERFRHVEVAILRPDGTRRNVAASGQPIADVEGRRLGAVVTLLDETELKRLELQFHQAQKMDALGKLAAGVAHDFNNLLTVIMGYCQLSMSRLRPGHAMHRDLDEISKAGERAARLTKQLLAFSRQQVLEPRDLDLNRVIGDMEMLLRRLIGAQVELEFVPGAMLGSIRADAGQLEQVLMNLVVNAKEAMPLGGHIRVTTGSLDVDELDATSEPLELDGVTGARLSLPPSGPRAHRYVALTVSDTGCGMSHDILPRIFEPFFTTKKTGEGSGLGLSTVHGIVTQSGGHISVTSQLGRGSTFRICFPRATLERQLEPGRALRLPPERGEETVLVVDDDAPLLRLVSEILRSHGYSVLEASNGVDALSTLEAEGHGVHALITDVVLPHGSGRELAESALAMRPDLPVLLMSGFVAGNAEQLGSLLGPGVRFIQKPFEPDDLLAKLREVLDNPAAEAA